MTIAVGFRCLDGVVLAADTLITFEGGTGKKYESKLFTVNAPLGIYLTYAGDPDFAKELVRSLQVSTLGRGEKQALSIVKQTYQTFYREHYTEPPKSEKSSAWILVTVLEGSAISLYQARERHFTKIPNYAALGIGFEHAEAIFSPLYRAWMSVEDGSYTARYALRKVKNFVQGCGGSTEIQIIRDNGQISFGDSLPQVSKEIEEDFDYLDSQFIPVLLTFSDMRVDKKSFRADLKELCKMLETYRTKKFKEQARKIKEFERDF